MVRKTKKSVQRGKGFGTELLKGLALDTLKNMDQIVSGAARASKNKKAKNTMKNRNVKRVMKTTKKLTSKGKAKKRKNQKGSGLLGDLLGKVPVIGDLSDLLL